MRFIDPDGRWIDDAGNITAGDPFSNWGTRQLINFSMAGPGDSNSGGDYQTMGELMDAYAKNAANPGNVDFSKFDFTQFGLDEFNPEEPVNFFGKEDGKAFHNRFKQQYEKFKDTEGDGIFRVYGHGNKRMIWNEDEMIFSAEAFDKAMVAKNKRWSEVDEIKNAMLFLYSCESARENSSGSSIGRKISIQHPNLTVVSFDGYVDYHPGLPGMSRVNQERYKPDSKGIVIIYKNGQVIYKNLYKNYIK